MYWFTHECGPLCPDLLLAGVAAVVVVVLGAVFAWPRGGA